MKGQIKIGFGQFKIIAKCEVNWNLESSVLLVCPFTIFRLRIPHNPIIQLKKIFLIQLNGHSKGKVCFILPVSIEMLFSLFLTKGGINFGHVRMNVTLYRIFWITITLDLLLIYALMVFRLVQIVLLL